MSSPNPEQNIRVPHVGRGFIAANVGVLTLILFTATAARATLPPWLQHILGASTIESALYRTMQLPAVEALYPRPPKESQAQLAALIKSTPNQADLYQLRARADEQSLDETAAEADWKQYAARANDQVPAQLELADFYQRRLEIPQAIAVLKQVAAAPSPASETYVDPTQQRSWRAFDRIFTLIHDQGLAPSASIEAFNAAIARYPDQPAVYAAYFQFELNQKDYAAAESLIGRYRQQFPKDAIFPVRAQALLEFRRGNVDAALAVYDKAFQPMWPPELIQSYLSLLDQTHRQRAFVAEARAQLAAHPDGPAALNALTRIFYYDQQAGRLQAAQQTLDAFRIAREARNGVWTPEDLSTLATLTTDTRSYAEAARYNFALASLDPAAKLPNREPAAQTGLSGLIHILLEAPDQPLALGAQNLTLYRDIATLDQGPGYWNGILSLWLNGTRPDSEYQTENAKAQTYFHRAKAAELLATLDQRYPFAPERPALHAELIRALSQYGEPATVITAGKEFQSAFPSAPEKLDVEDLMADAYARQNDTSAEFALYDAQLAELSAETEGQPLSAAANAPPPPPDPNIDTFLVTVPTPDSTDTDAKPAQNLRAQPLTAQPQRKSIPAATAYARILDRYIGRLTATGDLPRALTVLRAQLDRNPNDPLLYERLATFLQQNNLSAQQEQVYEAAIAKFQQPTYYDKLARFYLNRQKSAAFADLTRKVTDIFSGTDLDLYFANVKPTAAIGPQLALQLNLYAAKRFPHDLVFTRNLLAAYQAKPTRDSAAYEALLRHSWWASDDLTTEFLTYLSRTGKLQSELEALSHANENQGAPPQTASSSEVGPHDLSADNPAALREAAEIQIFTSHYEQAAPLLSSVATLYPADPDTGDQAVSLFRSLAYLDPTTASTSRAVALETNLVRAEPDSPDRLATLGDLYAEATSTGGEDLASAAPYWQRIPQLHPGSTQGYLTAATIFWDYFQFADATAELTAARAKFHDSALFGYEAGAIDENRHDIPAAIAEYTNAVLHPIDTQLGFDSGAGVIKAWLNPPSDAADSNFRSTAQSFLGSEQSQARLLQLATRPATKAAVDTATQQAVADNPSNSAALTLRADILAAQHHAPELQPLLTTLFNQALDHTTTLDEAAAVGTLAQARSLTPVYERALAKQAALTTDPVQKIQLQYALATSLESHNDIAAAARIIDSVYTANPRILGVVRATTDFYVRTNQPPRAIATLLEAAKVATPTLARDFTLEAASRANDANDTAQARTLALSLLPANPYDAQVLNLIATSYARAHDDAGLKQFYLTQLDAAKTAPNLTPDARKQDVALLRRGLIPALTRLNDPAGATAQYIALLSAFPEDTSTAGEAALYALKHSTQPQLLTFYRTTIQQSPRDSRFMILLAQTETTFEDLPAAESAYTLAIAIRPDRADLYTARADLELRLSQSDPRQSDLAAADFAKLYLLTYHDPAWMVRLAELRARQQRPADAVKALETAYITGHAPAADDSFKVANQLSQWNLLPEARTYAEQGAKLAGDKFLTTPPTYAYPQPPSNPILYARILTRLGQADQALATLTAARKAAEASATSPTVLAAELARLQQPGNESYDASRDNDADALRKALVQQHLQTADSNLRTAVQAVGQTVNTFYTPEQKKAFATTLDQLHTTSPQLALEAATSAGLADREADFRKQILLNGSTAEAAAQLQPYTALEQRRLQFEELAQTLETYATQLKLEAQTPIRQQAAQAYRDAGDLANETRLDRSLVLAQEAGNIQARYFDLLLAHNQPALIALAANRSNDLADAALNYTVAHASEQQALAAVARRGQSLPAVWRPASASLVETYFASPKTTPTPPTGFAQSLASNLTIADHLATPADPAKQLTGDNFFFYASRFGIFLATVPKSELLPDAEDFLPAELEASPSSPTPYLNLARTYAEANDLPAALAEYHHALSLAPAIPSGPAIQDEMAVALYRAGKHDEAIAQWHDALATLRRMQQKAIYPEAWFTSLETILQHIGEHHLTASFTPDIQTILGPYLAKNGNYRSNELLKAVYQASATPTEGTSLILTLANSAVDPLQILDDLRPDPTAYTPESLTWLSLDSRATILQREAELAEARQDDGGYQSPSRYKEELIELYLAQDELAKAQATLNSIPAEGNKPANSVEMDRIILAVRTNHLAPLLDQWRANPDFIPSDTDLNSALYRLQKPTAAYKPNPATLRPLQEFLFERKDLDDKLAPTDFLALAKSRLDTNDLPGALELLRRLTLQPPSSSEYGDLTFPADPTSDMSQYASLRGESVYVENRPQGDEPSPYKNTDFAATLLEHTHHTAEAIPFLQSLVSEVPWDASYRLRLARAQLATNVLDAAQHNLIAVASDASAPYELRVQATTTLAETHPTSTPDLGSRELADLLNPTPATARQPYFAAARIAAAALPSTSAGDRDSLLREAIALSPDSSTGVHTRLSLLINQPPNANPSATLAILNSLNQAQSSASSYAATDDGSDTDTTADSPEVSPQAQTPTPATLPPGALTLDLPTRIHLATQLASAYERDGDLPTALSYAQLALDLQTGTIRFSDQTAPHNPPDPALVHRRDALKTAVELARRNAARIPTLHKELAQSNQIRPRLTPAGLAQLAQEDAQ
jgi:tetratricopeptide (TPR) repeat protein